MAETSPSRVTYDFVTRAIARTLGNPGKGYFALLAAAVALLGVGIVCLLFLLRYGLGLAGYSHPVYWAVYITCFVFWVGIAHSGTLISAILFLFMGLIPDIAAVRDVATGWRKKLYAITALGWRGTNEQWRHYARGYLYLAALATPLVLSVHSVVSWDFAMAIVPGWHATIFAPYFVAGAIYSGVALVITLLVPIRKLFRLEDLITVHHFQNLAKLCL